jgi:TPR repeat protein
MANREQAAEMRKARAGDALAQLALAKRYLSGDSGLARNEITALLWLDRAARQGSSDAALIIGNHISFEVAQRATDATFLLQSYKRAFDAGVDNAGLVFAKLALTRDELKRNESLRAEALEILELLASTGVPDAQWLLARTIEGAGALPKQRSRSELRSSEVSATGRVALDPQKNATKWTVKAAISGVGEARFELADRAWASGDYSTFLRWAAPLARTIFQENSLGIEANNASLSKKQQLTTLEVELLFRCGDLLGGQQGFDVGEPRQFLEMAACEGNRSAQLKLGLWLAKLDSQSIHGQSHPRRASFKCAISWLTEAGNQGSAEAWYAVSKVYLKAEFSDRSLVEAERFLERAAELGHRDAQFELGVRAWRSRHKDINADVAAMYWLQNASAQGNAEAGTLLSKIAPRAEETLWAKERLQSMAPGRLSAHPFLAARIELATLFGLTQTEALWLDIIRADQGHCLIIDVSDNAPKTKRRLVPLVTTEEREAVDRVKLLFQGIDCGISGPEGNYRKRLYRLEKLLCAPEPEPLQRRKKVQAASKSTGA